MTPQQALPTSWPAPAKLNLFLHITGRREDGYHNLQTVFQFLDYGDDLSFSVREDGAIHRRSDLPGVSAEQDLVVRAARLLQAKAGIRQGIDISVDKRLPLGGGLGGGSSNAATTLLALNRIWGINLSLEQLAEMGLGLGADVPVFIQGQAAWAEGVGEHLAPVELPEPWYVVLAPPVSVSTAEIFAARQLLRDCPPITIRDFLAGQGMNVCEPVVLEHYPEVKAAFDDLGQFGDVRMTGTGACVFSAFAHRDAAQAAWQALKGRWQGFVAQGMNTSPLKRLLAAQ